MADEAAKEEATKQRIINHMNKDHHDSIIRYLEHYCHLSSWTAFDGKMTGINLDGMTFVCSGRTYQILFQPPLSSYRDARPRVVDMDKACLQALEKSDITIREFVPPTGFDAIVFFAVLATLLAYNQRWWFSRGGPVEAVLGSTFAKFSWTIQPGLFWGMLAIHGAELIYFIMYKLNRHSVNVRTTEWWLWAGTTFFEGQSAYHRFNRLLEAKRREKEGQKH